MTRLKTLGALLMVAGFAGCSADVSGGDTEPAPQDDVHADLRADSNRDGVVSVDDDSDGQRTVWDKAHGAVFLANIDDDTLRCKANTRDDVALAACNDAEDDVVNGPDDALDLARLKTKPWPKTPDDATGRIGITPAAAKDNVRLFKRIGDGPADFEVLTDESSFSAAELRAGIELAIEGKDIARDADLWDGKVEVQLTISSPTKGNASDKVVMRVAPVLTFHHLLPAEKIWVSNTTTQGNADLRSDLGKACVASGLERPSEIRTDDSWTQDFFEPAYMSMPTQGGAQHVIRVNYRSANVEAPRNKKTPLRPAGQVVFAKMRGKDVAGVQQFDISHDGDMDTLNSLGNLETVPPHERDGTSYPFGRIIRGSVKSYYPDPTFAKMLRAQGMQPEILVDTSWLLVGHIDETTSWVKANTPHGFALVVNDPRLAKKMLEDAVAAGKGDTQMFVGKSWFDFETAQETPAAISIKNVLADTTVMQASAEAAAEIDAQLEIIKKEVGLTDDEIVHVPFLHTTIAGKSAAFSPATVNGVYLSDTHFGAPDPHGPVIDGKDIFKTGISDPLAKLGITVAFIEDWDDYHLGVGDVHCGSNSTRKIPDSKWWESGR